MILMKVRILKHKKSFNVVDNKFCHNDVGERKNKVNSSIKMDCDVHYPLPLRKKCSIAHVG